MKLLGEWNWYLPKWLEWLPRVEHEKAPEAPAVPAAAPSSGVDRRSAVGRLARAAATRVAAALRTEVGLARVALARRRLYTSSTTTSCSQTPGPRPAITSSAASCHSGSSSLAGVVYPRSRGRAGDDRAARRLLRRPRRHGGRSLHESGRAVRRRLHRVAVDPGRPRAARPRRRHAVEISAKGRPALVEVPAPPLSAQALFVAMAVLLPVAIAYVVTHAARARFRPQTSAPYKDVEFTTATACA